MTKIKVMLRCFGLILIFVSQFSVAASCLGHKSFTVSFEVIATDGNQYVQMMKNGNQPKEVIWYTKATTAPATEHIFQEKSLVTGHKYEVIITQDQTSGLSQYYLRQLTPLLGSWELKQQSNKSFTNGNLEPSESDSILITDTDCQPVISPPIVPPSFFDDARFEFGEIKQSDCYSGCSINFIKEYRTTPIVMLMPSIDGGGLSNDEPSSVFVKAIGLDGASIVQKMPASVSNNPTAMQPIYYLVAEPGYVTLDSRLGNSFRAQVGSYNITDYQAKGADAGESWFDADFSANFASGTPLVLTQLQSSHQSNLWATTTVRNVTFRDFDVALEIGQQAIKPSSPQKVGYFAAVPQTGLTTEGQKYEIALPSGLYGQSNGSNTEEYLQWSCSNNYLNFLDSLDKYGVIVNKQTRNGGDGGWLRLCDLSKTDSFSFVFDEDKGSRRHGEKEKVGFFAFELEHDFSLDICPYVPSVAQSNAYYNGALYDGGLEFTNGAGNIAVIPENDLALSFAFNTADIAQCVYPNGQRSCLVDSALVYDHFPINLNSYDTSGKSNISCSSSSCQPLNTGVYNNINISKDATLVLNGGVYYFNQLNFSDDGGQIVINGPVEIHYKSILLQKNNIRVNQGGNPNHLLMIGHGQNAFVEIGGDNLEFFGYWYVDHLATDKGGFDISGDNNKLYGGVTAYSLRMSGWTNILNGQIPSSCDTSPQDNYTLELAPSSDIGLTCETLTPTVRVLNNGVLATNFSGSVTVLVDGIPQQLTPVNGVLEQTLSLTVNQTKTVAVEAYINGDQANTTVTGQYQFVPFKFAIDDQYVVASKPQSVEAQVMACDSGNVVDIGYNGTPVITSTLTQPLGGMGVLTYSPVFASGTSTSDLTFTDSGVVQVQLEDGNFDCTGVQGCPIEGSSTLKGQFHVNSRPWTFAICSGETPAWTMDGTSSSGTKFKLASERFNLHVKPIVWQSGGAVSGEIETSSYCNAAITQNFFASNAPSAVVEMSSALHSPMGGSTSVLLQGDNGLSKVHNSGSGSGTNQHYDFTQLYWDEVGSLKVMADTQANYLGMDINLGYRNIGRFVPEKLVLASNSWTYATGHSGFAYMNQPIEHAFSVEAQNASDQVTQNYGLFDSAYVSTVSYFNVDNAHKEIVDRVKDYSTLTWQQPAWSLGALNVTLTQYEFVKKAIPPSPSPYTTEPDGPYTQGFGLWASTVVDGVDFENKELEVHDSGAIVKSGKAFSEQPDFRYGRMRLQDVGGFTGNQIEVPLTTEYWNGSQFLTNGDDSGSDFDGSQFCRQLIWHSQAQTSSNASLSGSGTVSVGRSDRLSAQQSTTDTDNQIREQVRFWLRVSDTTLQKVATTDNDIQCNGSGVRPWLRFNWRNLGDEDPNAVVTFGINRGNDRVIYKGESGLTGQ
ncbi:DUF6701 domain-containing protein [Vibrio vulnificus]|uniref:DUF6701 domain-containing protein n=1 Tax=Vibrio vulnificus TaxID=672 RepID=UPI001A185B3D|nr:MSHA biogenesis protein MshQ [Vibrio vulnificus]HDY7492993.1 MSHA biogenesis protein MshQ [Vibrio vulnificus]